MRVRALAKGEGPLGRNAKAADLPLFGKEYP